MVAGYNNLFYESFPFFALTVLLLFNIFGRFIFWFWPGFVDSFYSVLICSYYSPSICYGYL